VYDATVVTISCFFCGGSAAWAVFADPQHSDPPFGVAYVCDRCRAALRTLLFERLRLPADALAGVRVASLTTDDDAPLSADPDAGDMESSAAITEIERLLGG
jgi:hypothetical protein